MQVLLGMGLLAAAGVMLGLAGEVGAHGSEVWAGWIVAALLLAASVPIAVGAGRRDADPTLTWILIGSAAAKLLGGLARYSLAYTFDFSGGRTDANGYYNAGIGIANSFSDRGLDLGGPIVGTRFIQSVTGVVYLVIPPSRLAGFFVFAFMSWIGLFLLTRAFRLSFPTGANRRYTCLVLFLPSMLFWPSSIGKEAWMTLMIGVAAYGAARLLTKRRWGFLILGLGLWGTAMVRPHVTLLLALALLVAYPIRRSSGRSTTAPLRQAVGFGVLILLVLAVASQAQSFFHVDSLDPGSVGSVLQEADDRSSAGGSEFQNEPVSSVSDLPGAFVDVPFRPFPWEASDWLQMLAAVEGLFLLGLAIWNLPRFRHLPSDMLRRPYVTFAVVYSAGFVIAFSTISNFGILVRQRVQLFPFLLVLLVPLGERTARRDEDLEPGTAPTPEGWHADPGRALPHEASGARRTRGGYPRRSAR